MPVRVWVDSTLLSKTYSTYRIPIEFAIWSLRIRRYGGCARVKSKVLTLEGGSKDRRSKVMRTLERPLKANAHCLKLYLPLRLILIPSSIDIKCMFDISIHICWQKYISHHPSEIQFNVHVWLLSLSLCCLYVSYSRNWTRKEHDCWRLGTRSHHGSSSFCL